MLFKNPKDSDAGLYKCVVSNELGECITNINLQIQGNKASLAKQDLIPPTLIEKPTIVMDGAKKCVRVDVKIRAKPEAKAVWFKDGKQLSQSNKYKFNVKKEADNVYILSLDLYVSL